MNFYTSDTHAYHANIIKYSRRPFKSVSDMNQALLDNINEVVGPNDRLYHLGDFTFGPRDRKDIQLANAVEFRKGINCKNVYLIFGNHDHLKRNKDFLKLFVEADSMMEILDPFVNKRITLCHYSMRVWNASHHGRWHLYGHSHGHLEDAPNFSFDVGVDCHNYKPLSSIQVATIMEEKVNNGVVNAVHHK